MSSRARAGKEAAGGTERMKQRTPREDFPIGYGVIGDYNGTDEFECVGPPTVVGRISLYCGLMHPSSSVPPPQVRRAASRHLAASVGMERLARHVAAARPREEQEGASALLGLRELRRVASLVPPPRANLTRFHGVFALGVQLRPFLFPKIAGAGRISLLAPRRAL